MLGRGVVCSLGLHQRGLGRVQIAAQGSRPPQRAACGSSRCSGSDRDSPWPAPHPTRPSACLPAPAPWSPLRRPPRRPCTSPCCPSAAAVRSLFSRVASNCARLHARSALHIELPHRRADLGRNGRLRQRRQHRIGGNVFGDRRPARDARPAPSPAAPARPPSCSPARMPWAASCAASNTQICLKQTPLLDSRPRASLSCSSSGSHRSGECLQISPRGLVAHSSVLARILRVHIGALRIHDLEHRGFSAAVAQLGQRRLSAAVATLASSEAS